MNNNFEAVCCEAMGTVVQPNDAKKGIVSLLMLNVAKSEINYVLAYRTGDRKHLRPIILNRCPWCGKAVNVKYRRKMKKKLGGTK